jgi:hypothetical protein
MGNKRRHDSDDESDTEDEEHVHSLCKRRRHLGPSEMAAAQAVADRAHAAAEAACEWLGGQFGMSCRADSDERSKREAFHAAAVDALLVDCGLKTADPTLAREVCKLQPFVSGIVWTK